MLSEASIFYIYQFHIFSDKLWLSPYQWNSKHERLEWTKIRKQFTFYILVLIYYTLDCMYLIYVMYKVMPSINVKFDVKLKIFLHSFTRIVGLGMSYLMLILRDHLSNFINVIIFNHRKLRSK